MSKKSNKIMWSVIYILIAVIFTILVKVVDVQAVGPQNSYVGFATLNSKVANIVGENTTWYKITEILGMLALLVAASYAVMGVVQLLRRKSIAKVNFEIIMLGVLYVVVVLLYIFFEKFIINYRPVLVDGVLEASFPSSHTMLAVCICASAVMVNSKLIAKTKFRKIYNILLSLMLVVIVVGRILSGVHWITDIIAGILISVALLKAFDTVIYIKNEE